ncbi:hypothetical protein MRX96_049587 [Rhipicephalus microplus]
MRQVLSVRDYAGFHQKKMESELRDDRKPWSTSRHSAPTRHEEKAARTASKSSTSTQTKIEVKVPETSN